MAEKKRVFEIKINGIEQSVDAVKSLNAQLKECDSIIKNLKDAKIDVKVSGGTTDNKTKVSGGTNSTETDKTSLEIEKEKTKQLELQTEELRAQLVQKEQLKQSNKETLDDIKQEAKGYIEVTDGVKTYANTLNGLSAELKDVKAQLRNTDIDSDAFDELTEKAASLNEKLKDAEQAYGQFGRNVGNYTQSIIDALNEWDSDKAFDVDFNISGAKGSLNDLKAELIELKKYWANLSPDDANFQKTADAIKSLTNQINDMESSLKDIGQEANSAFTGRFTTTIGGVEASFSNASEACEALRKKLVAMRVAGEENTPMYQEIIELTRRLAKEVQIANKQVEGMTKMSASLNKVVGVMKGLSGVASLGQGIAGLFGGTSEELDNLISKFASLMLVANGISALEEELNKGTSSFAKFANALDEKLLEPLTKGITAFGNTTQAIVDYQKQLEQLKAAQEEYNKILDGAGGLISEDVYMQRVESLQTLHSEMEGLLNSGVINTLDNELNKLASGEVADDSGVQRVVEYIKQNVPEATECVEKYVAVNEQFMNESNTANETAEKLNANLNEQSEIEGKLNEQLSQLSPLGQKAAKAFASMGTAGAVAAKAVNGLTIAVKGFAKATVVLALVQALAEAMDYLMEGAKKAWTWLKSLFGIMSDDQAKRLATDVDNLGKKLDAISKEYDIQIKIGNMGEVEASLQRLNDQLQMLADTKSLFDGNDEVSEWMEELRTELDTTDEDFQKLTKTEQDAALGLQKLAEIDPTAFEKLKNLKPEKQLSEIEKMLGGNVNQLNAVLSILGQDDDAVEKFLDKLSDIDWDLNDIGVDGVKAFGKLATQLQNLRTQASSAVQTINNDLKSLSNKNIQLKLQLDPTNASLAFQSAISDMASMAARYGITMSQDGLKFTAKQGDQTGAAIAKQLEENAKLQKQITDQQAADRKKQLAQQAENERKQKAEEAKRAAEQARQHARNEANARIEAMKEGFDKEMAQLKQKRKEELEDAKETGKSVNTINELYDRLELELKTKYAKYVEDEQREHNKRLMTIAQDFLSEWTEIQRQIEDTKADTSMGNVENKNISVKQNITYDTNTSGDDGVKAMQDYYTKLRDAENDYLKEKEQLEIESAQRELQRQIEDEEARFQQEKKANEESIEEYKRALDQKVESGQISQEMANTELEQLTEAYHKDDEARLQQHNETIASLTENGEARINNIKLQYQEERQKNNMDELNNEIDATQDFYNNIDKIMDRMQKRSTNSFGFMDYSSYKKSLQDALTATEQTAAQIEDEKTKLQKALDNKEISFDDFQKAKKQLDEFTEEVKDKTKELQDSLGSSFNTWMSSVMNTVNQYASVLSGMFDTLNEMATRELDAEQDALDEKQELLDKELEMIEEQLEEQEEITKEHSDNIDGIEDELSSARGDRRQALIDQLAAEKKAQEASIAEEKKLTDEKKKNAKKQEQLEKEQDALEKKRKKQEKKAAIVQATINTFTAVSNALAVQPWFVGLALSAVALGLGMANVAQISSQQYADGGLLNGKSHKQGGMKIQGSNIEVEGGEMVVNKASTNANLPLLEYINSNRRTLTKDDLVKFYDNGKTTLINRPMKTKFEDGGQLPQLAVNVKDLMNSTASQQETKQSVVSVVDIINAMDNVEQVRVLAGDTDND